MENFIDQESDQDTVKTLRQASTKSQSESLGIIENASYQGMNAGDYAADQTVNDLETNIQKRTPSQVATAVKDYNSESPEHANATAEENGPLTTLANMARHTWYTLSGEKNELEDKRQNLLYKARNSENGLNAEDLGELEAFNEMIQDDMAEFDLEGLETVPGEVGGVINDVINSIGNHKNTIAAASMTGATIGLFTPFIGTAPAGAVTGLGIGVTVAMATDAYYKVSNSTYGDIITMKNDDGTPLNLPHGTAQNISIGVGVLSGAMEAFTGHVLTAGASKLVGLTGRKLTRTIINNVPLKAKMDILGQTLKASGVSGLEEVSADLVAKMGEHIARSGDTSIEGITSAVGKTIDDLSDPEFRKQLGMTAVVGSVASGVISSGTSALTYKGIKANIENQNLTVEETLQQQSQAKVLEDSLNVLTSQDKFLSMSKISMETEFKKLSPVEMTKLKEKMFNEAGFKDKVWFSEADMMKIEEANPELADKIKTLDVTESANNNTGAAFGIKPNDFSDLVDDFPTVSEYHRNNPEGPSPLESKAVLARLEDNKQKMEAYLNDIGVGETLTPEQMEGLAVIKQEGRDILSEGNTAQDYLNKGDYKITDVPDKQLEKFNEAQARTRKAVHDQVEQEFMEREQKIEDRIVRANEKIETKEQRRKLGNDLDIVDMYKAKFDQVDGKKVKTDSLLAIDPDSLPENLKEAYLTEPNLKKRKVFKKGGITLEESAALAGVENGEALLKVLANTPTPKEMLQQRKQRSKELRKQVKEVREKSLDERRDKVFDDIAKLEKAEIEHMKAQEWTGTKQGLKKFMLETPQPATLNNRASVIVKNTKVGELSARQYNGGRKSSQTKAANHILKNEVSQAIHAKEQSMLNSELTRESLKMERKINDARIWLNTTLTNERSKRSLKKSGMLSQVDDIMSIFNLLPNKQQGIEQASYFDHIARLEQQGQTVIVPQRLNDVRQRGTDLTSEQFMKVVDDLKTILHKSKNKAALISRIDKMGKIIDKKTEAAIVVERVISLRESQGFDPSRLQRVEGGNNIPLGQHLGDIVNGFNAGLTNMKNVALELDDDSLSGMHQEVLTEPLVNSETKKRGKLHDTKNQIITIAEEYGTEKFETAFNEVTIIPEFEGYPHLNNGHILKSDLWMLAAYLGDPQHGENMGNFTKKTPGEIDSKGAETGAVVEKMDRETVVRVLDRVLDKSDMKLVQNLVNMFDANVEESKQLHFRTTGVMPDMVKGVPWELHGVMIPGGYVPGNYKGDSHQMQIERFLDIESDRKLSMFGGDVANKDKHYAKLRAAEHTEQGRLKSRTGSAMPLDISFLNLIDAFEEVEHDLAYRESGVEVLKLLKNKAYADAIKSKVGIAKYEVLVDATIETVGKTSEFDETAPHKRTRKGMLSGFRRLREAYAVKVLGAAWKSVAMQPLSAINSSLTMGKGGAKHLTKSFGTAVHAISNGTYGAFMKEAQLINDDLITNMDSIDDMLSSSMSDVIPKTRKLKSKGAMMAAAGLDWIKETSMIGLQQFDIHIKAVVSMGAASQFINGEVKNFPKEKLDKMTMEQKRKEMKRYVKQVADLALTTSADIDKNALQKIEQVKMFTMFYNDVRSQYLVGTSQIRKAKSEGVKGVEALKEGDKTQALKHSMKSAGHIGTLMLAHTLNQMYDDMIHDEETPISDLSNVKDFKSLKKFIGKTATYAGSATPNVLLGSIPGVKDVKYTLGSWSQDKKARTIPSAILSDAANTMQGLTDMMNGQSLSRKQKLAIGGSFSVAVSGFPVNGPAQIHKMITESKTFKKTGNSLKRMVREFSDRVDDFEEEHKDDPKMQDAIDGMKEYRDDLTPESAKNEIPEDALEKLKLNKWDDINIETGAAGVYQFTEERWNEIQDEQPSLGLTDEGRTSEDPEEQEKAMAYSLKEHALDLEAMRIKVNSQSLYGMHRFGLDNYIAIISADNNDKLTDIVEDLTLFEGFTTVKSVKEHIAKQIKIDNK